MYPEISGQEKNTAEIITEFVGRHNPTSLDNEIAGHGILVSYDFREKGPSIVIRCDMDALPINETTHLDYKSQNNGVAHKCGHDGHMAIAAGLAPWLNKQNFNRGKVVLLFQPAEETAVGAKAMLEEQVVKDLRPDYVIRPA